MLPSGKNRVIKECDMEHKMRKQETAEAMGRGRDTLTRRNFSKRRQRGGFAKKGMA